MQAVVVWTHLPIKKHRGGVFVKLPARLGKSIRAVLFINPRSSFHQSARLFSSIRAALSAPLAMYLRMALIAQAHEVAVIESERPARAWVVGLHEGLDVVHVVRGLHDSLPFA